MMRSEEEIARELRNANKLLLLPTGAANAMEPGFPSRRFDLCDIEIPYISRVLGSHL